MPLVVAALIAAHLTYRIPQIRARGWPAAVPTTALIVATPWILEESSPLMSRRLGSMLQPTRSPPGDWRSLAYVELVDHRITERSLRGWQWRLLLQVCLAQERSRLFTDLGDYGFGHLLVCADEAGQIDRLGLRTRVNRLIQFEVTTRESWPAGVPIQARTHIRTWRPMSSVTARLVLHADPQVSFVQEQGSVSHRCVFPPEWSEWNDALEPFITVKEPSDCLPMRINYAGKYHGSGSAMVLLDSRDESLPIRITKSIDEIMTPVESEAIISALRASDPPILHDGRFMQWNPTLDEIALDPVPTIAVRVEVLYKGAVCLTGGAWWGYCEQCRIQGSCYRHLRVSKGGSVPLRGQLPQSNSQSEGWTVRLTGDPIMALRDFESSTYWSGSIEIPCSWGEAKGWRDQFESRASTTDNANDPSATD